MRESWAAWILCQALFVIGHYLCCYGVISKFKITVIHTVIFGIHWHIWHSNRGNGINRTSSLLHDFDFKFLFLARSWLCKLKSPILLAITLMHQVARGFTRGAFEVKPLMDDKANINRPQISMLQPTDAVTYNPGRKVTLFPVKKWKTSGKWINFVQIHFTLFIYKRKKKNRKVEIILVFYV